ncbi:MAG: uroporphyrinogen-III C-methyltransferase [Pseudomonadota bacterium]
MSDQENTPTEKASDETPEAPEAKPPATAAPRKSTSLVGWLALLLVLALAGGAGWLLPQLQGTEQSLDARIGELEQTAKTEDKTLTDLQASLQGEFRQQIDAIQAEQKSESADFEKKWAEVDKRLAAQRAELSRFNAQDRESWLLAEAEYLLRLANQRLIMAGDTVSARALLTSADSVLKEVDDPALHDVRAAVASDLAAVRAVPTVDVAGIYLRLSALSEQAGQLVIFELPGGEAQPEMQPAANWQGRIKQGYEAAVDKLSNYIIIRRRDEPMQTLMDPQWEGLVRQNLRMLIEQAQVALLSGNQTLYVESLERAQHWVKQFEESDAARASAIHRELVQLGDETVAVTLPDLAKSMQALDVALEQRLQQRRDTEQ